MCPIDRRAPRGRSAPRRRPTRRRAPLHTNVTLQRRWLKPDPSIGAGNSNPIGCRLVHRMASFARVVLSACLSSCLPQPAIRRPSREAHALIASAISSHPPPCDTPSSTWSPSTTTCAKLSGTRPSACAAAKWESAVHVWNLSGTRPKSPRRHPVSRNETYVGIRKWESGRNVTP